MPAPFEIKVVTIDSTSWTPITVAFDCTNLSIKNKDTVNAVRMRTNPSDPLTEDLLGPAAEQGLAIPFHRYRYAAGSQPVFVQAVAGTGPVVVKFLV
jgi:hypothetical protein